MGVFKNSLKICGGIRGPRSSANKVQPNLFCNFFKAWKFAIGFFEGLIFGPVCFGGFVGSPRDCFWVLIFAPIRSSRHLKSGVSLPSGPEGHRLVACSAKKVPSGALGEVALRLVGRTQVSSSKPPMSLTEKISFS